MYKILTKELWAPSRALAKLLLIMRLTTFILITAILQVSAAGYAQKITLNERNTPLMKVFDKISTQSGLDFLVPASVLKESKPVNINVSQMELEKVLEQLFVGTELNFKIAQKSVVISRRERSLLDGLKKITLSAFQNKIDVRGRIVDSASVGLQGASVRVKRTGKVTNTGANGEFSIQGLDESDVLQISYVGYILKEVPVKTGLMMIVLAP
ncbi:putative outer membrane protein, partial [Pedobacter sp. BAL39]|uniref:STN domain-containing protein n=1 Tax=Pedobacter sp. BAL39 TaxID=391596 RepID=UPI000155AD94